MLDHCVLKQNVRCRSRRDCTEVGSDALCVLSGYSPGPRGNSAMTAECLPSHGSRPPEASFTGPGSPAAAPLVEPRLLLETAAQHAKDLPHSGADD